MTEFRLKGKEMLIKTPSKHGTGAIVYVPVKWLGEKVAIIRGVKDES